MTRDEVLIEFHEPYNYEIFPGLRRKGMQLNTEAMADEIVRLRTLDNERKARRAAREPIHSLYDILVQLSEENDDLIEERNRLRVILAMLKKPDIDVLASAMTAWSRTGDVPAMLHAALTTAEQEVAS